MANSTKISEYSTTAASNTSIDSIDIDENCAASGINNAIRSVLKHQADAFTQGTPIALDQTNNRVGIGTSTPTAKVHSVSSGAVPSFLAVGGTADFAVPDDENMQFSHYDASAGTSTERMRIDTSGRLLIGTTTTGASSTQKFEVNGGMSLLKFDHDSASPLIIRNDNSVSGDGVPHIVFQNSSGNRGAIFRNSSNEIGLHGQGAVTFHTGGTAPTTERMRIDSSGNVYFNQSSTSSPGLNNTTQGAVISDTGRLFSSVNGAWSLFNRNTDNGAVVLFRRSGSGVGEISVTQSSTTYSTSSDYRLKENVSDMTGAIARVKQLAPKRFNFIVDADTTVDGFLAHEAQTVVPEAVTGTHNGLETWSQREIDDGEAPDGTSAGDNKLDEDGNTIPEMQGIDQAKLVPLLTGALQEAIAKIETLETEMTALKARVTALEA